MRKKERLKMLLKCRHCGSTAMFVNIRECYNCEFNGAYNDDTEEYTYDKSIIEEYDLERTEQEDTGTCSEDRDTNGLGCTVYICSKCGRYVDSINHVEC